MKHFGLAAVLTAFFASGTFAQDNMASELQNACSSNQCLVSEVTSALVAPGIEHVSAVLKVGNGLHDKIRIHRVVQITSNGKAKHGLPGVFMAHPEPLSFDAAFLHGYNPSDTAGSSIAVFMAQGGLDVWGYDERQALVTTADAADLSFMASWDLLMDVHDARTSLLVARAVRGLTGSGIGKVGFFGYARGGQTGYVLLEQESQLPSYQRSVSSFIPMEILMKTDDASVQAVACASVAAAQAALNAGQYAQTFGSTVLAAAGLAAADPNGASPFVPGLTNFQVLIFFGGATYQFAPAYTSYFHFAGSVLVNGGFPVSFLYMDPNALLSTMLAASPFSSQGAVIQGDGVACSDTPLDDHLHDITVPVLYVGAQGGFGTLGYHTLDLLGSQDITRLNISLQANPASDFGHDDVLRSETAKNLAWTPMRTWLLTH